MDTIASNATRPTGLIGRAADSPIRPVRFPGLLSVELRKATDTRASRALLAGVLTISAALLVWKVTQHPGVPVAFENYGRAVATFVAFLIPLVAVTAMSSEWTQRTALTTFTLAPRRAPVLGAKYVAAMLVSLGALAVGLALAAAATMVGGAVHGAADFGDAAATIRTAVVYVALQVTMGAAFGALVVNTPAALSAFLLAPTVWSVASNELLGDVAPWFDVFRAYDRLASAEPFADGAQTVTALSVWIVLPVVAGVFRSLRREVK